MSEEKEIIPHQTIMQFQGEVFARRPDGKVNPLALCRLDKIFTLFGDSLEECKAKMEAFAEAINRIPEETIQEIMKEQNDK